MFGGFLSGDSLTSGSISETKNSSDYPIRVANLQPSQVTVTRAATSPVPEAATWAMMVIGFGALGATMRRRQQANVTFA